MTLRAAALGQGGVQLLVVEPQSIEAVRRLAGVCDPGGPALIIRMSGPRSGCRVLPDDMALKILSSMVLISTRRPAAGVGRGSLSECYLYLYLYLRRYRLSIVCSTIIGTMYQWF
jgi:hypothetical protein